MVNVYERISEWLVECPIFDGYLYFNVIPVENGNSSLNSNSSSTIIKNFLDGSKEVQLYFTINVVKEYDNGGTSDLNLDAINSFSEIVAWVEQKNHLQEFPDLGQNCTVNEVVPSYTIPEVYLTPDNPGIARYEGRFSINYLERK